MSGVLIHDGRRPGQLKWSLEALSAGVADGAILTPFATPRTKEPRYPSASEVAKSIGQAGGEVIFDPMTHAAVMAQSDRFDFYDGWGLWGSSDKSLQTPAARLSHVERVFKAQDQVGAPRLAPTLAINAPLSAEATYALEIANVARSLESSAWQSLAGTRAFWSSGSRLDAHIGVLASLRAPVWVVTVVNESVGDNVPDMADTEAFEGLCRSIHSLSIRSRVIIAQSDYSGLPAVAAGADTVGSGWDRGQRTFDPLSFRQSDGSPRRSASYVTQGGLLSVLRRDAADVITQWDSSRAFAMRGGPMPPSDQIERIHHFRQLRGLIQAINSGTTRQGRVDELRRAYTQAAQDYDDLVRALRPTVTAQQKLMWIENPRSALEAYSLREGL